MQHHSTRLFNSSVEIDSSKNSLERIHQQRLFRPAARLFFTFPQLQVVAQMDLLRIFHEVRGADEEAFQLRKLTFRQFGMGSEKEIADKKTENGVAKELELFIISFAGALFIRVRTVRERLTQQLPVFERVPQLEFEIL